jgi:hypothetical protein
LKYLPQFANFSHVNPRAPKAGASLTFDNFNMAVDGVKGVSSPPGLISPLKHCSRRRLDEVSSEYGLRSRISCFYGMSAFPDIRWWDAKLAAATGRSA